MLSPKTQYSLANAQSYFEEHLAAADYYVDDLSRRGHWIGTGAQRLGLLNEVRREEFLALCANQHPQAGGLLTQKLQARRTETSSKGEERSVANRRVFYDFTISAPKSVSIAGLVGGDSRILEAHRNAVDAAVREMEPFAETRVRAGGLSNDRSTGNLVCALFTHTTSRALDPHLHTHCIVFNATFDPVENRWKALQNRQLLRAQKFVENVYYHSLAQSLLRMGYGIENHRRGDFDIRGIPQELCARFSKRHEEIERATKKLLEKHPEKALRNVLSIRENIAMRERQSKVSGVTPEQLRSRWEGELNAGDKAVLAILPSTPADRSHNERGPGEALTWAEQHVFERRSVVAEHELWRQALEFARGSNFDVVALKQAASARGYLRNRVSPQKISLQSVLEREWRILELVRSGVGRCEPLAKHGPGGAEWDRLDPEQKSAVQTIWGSRDMVTLFRGGAGTGKSFTLKEVVRGIRGSGFSIHVVAPQRQQACDLDASGLDGATTLSEFLARKSMMRGAVVILDEAGQVGATQMEALLLSVKAAEGRLICSGDTRQHGAVEGSDALRTIEKYAGIQFAEIRTIRRQDPARAETEAQAHAIREYRTAVAEAADGSTEESLARLERLGAVMECLPEERHESLAALYTELSKKDESPLVVGQTWTEVRQLNQTVREALKRAGKVSDNETLLETLEQVDVTDAQKQDARFYGPQRTVVFTRPVVGFRRNEQATVVGVTRAVVIVAGEGRVREIPISKLQYLRICERRTIPIASGDRLQLKANATAIDGKRLCNGELVTVSSVGADGIVHLKDGRRIPSDYRQFGYGFAVTSYASQGKTVDHVLFSDSGVKAATNREQWYVTISRGRKSVRIFTSDKEGLRESIARSGHRELATDVFCEQQKTRNKTGQRWMAGKRLMLGLLRRLSFAALRERCNETAVRRTHD